MLEKIFFKKEIYAIILRKKYKSSGIKFFTPNKFSQQLAYMKRPKGYVIKPHIHKKVKKEIKFTQEVLFIRSGKVKVEFFNNKKIFIEKKKFYKKSLSRFSAEESLNAYIKIIEKLINGAPARS